MGYSREQTTRAFLEASDASQTQDMSSLWPAVLCRLKEDQVYGLPIQPNITRVDDFAVATTRKHTESCIYCLSDQFEILMCIVLLSR